MIDWIKKVVTYLAQCLQSLENISIDFSIKCNCCMRTFINLRFSVRKIIGVMSLI